VFAKFVDDPAGDAGVCPKRTTIMETERHEIEFASDVAFGGKADVFASKFGYGCRRQEAEQNV